MRYLKTYEELSPEFLNKAAGDRDTAQKKKIGSEADLRKKMEDPEYVASLNKKADADKSEAEKKQRISQVFGKYFPKSERIDIYAKVVEKDERNPDRKVVTVFSLSTYIVRTGNQSFELEVDGDEGLYIDGELKADGTILLDSQNVEDMVKNFIREGKDLRGYNNSGVKFSENVVEFSIIGIDLKEAVGFAAVINAIYGTKITKDNLKIVNQKLGIIGKDFDCCKIDSQFDGEVNPDFEKECNHLNKYGEIYYQD